MHVRMRLQGLSTELRALAPNVEGDDSAYKLLISWTRADSSLAGISGDLASPDLTLTSVQDHDSPDADMVTYF